MKMALVGAGGMGGIHLGIYESMADIEIAAVVDIDTEKAKAKTMGRNYRIYHDIQDMLEKEELDFIDICTPSYLHEEHAVLAMNKGVHVICEKPITLNSESAARMVEAAEKNRVIFMVAQVIRFWPHYVFLKECYDGKTFGKLYHASFSRVGEIPPWSWENWMQDQNRSGRVPVDLHIHDADFIRWMMGSPKAVTGTSIEDSDKISYISAHYEYEDCYIDAEGGWFGCPLPFSMSYRAAFEKAVLEYKDGKLMIYEKGAEPREMEFADTVRADTGINISSTDGYANEIRYFISCIKKGIRPEITTPASSAASIRLVEKTLESARLGRKLQLK